MEKLTAEVNLAYEPYGPEWQKALLKLPKKMIIEMAAKIGVESYKRAALQSTQPSGDVVERAEKYAGRWKKLGDHMWDHTMDSYIAGATENQQGGYTLQNMKDAFNKGIDAAKPEVNNPPNYFNVLIESIGSPSIPTKAEVAEKQQPSLSREQVKEKKDEGHGMCLECKQAFATKDYNGHNYWVCDTCFDRLSDEFEEVYK